MNEFLMILVTAASIGTSSNCAAISNFTDDAVWKAYNKPVQYATYRDMGSPLSFSRRVPQVVRMAEATLGVGGRPPGVKIRVACNIQVVA